MKWKQWIAIPGVVFLLVFGIARVIVAEEEAPVDSSELAKKTQNPVSDIISIPFQFNFNSGGGYADQTFFNLNFQPVIPFKVSSNWNMIARTIVPVVSVPVGDARFSGIADIQEQMFFSPSHPGKIIWGAGPVLSLPTATADPVRTGSWAAGPNFVVLTMPGHWVLGVLTNQAWTYADSGGDPKVNQFNLQWFVNYNFGKGWALSTGPLITANWDAPDGEKWTVPLGLGITRTTVFDKRPMTIGAQYYHNVKHPSGAAADQLRLIVTLIYPGGH